jgi:ketosteroid isomerase-like protein
MKRNAWILVSLLALFAFAVAGCTKQSVAPTNDTGPSRSASPTVDRGSIERELLRIENDWPRVLKEKDVEAVKRVEADDVVIVYPDGSTGGKDMDVKDIETGALSAESFEMADLKVNVLNADAAVVSGRSVVKNGKYKMPDGKTIDISGEYRFIDTFARRDGQWKLVAGASVPVRMPAGSASPSPSAAKASPSPSASRTASPAPSRTASPY